jgi:two-component system sensor histidine kinase KdpD
MAQRAFLFHRGLNSARVLWRVLISGVAVSTLLVVCTYVPHVDHAAVGLLLVLCEIALARTFGRIPAWAAALFGAVGFHYYFLLPRGGSAVAVPEQMVALGALLACGIAAIELAVRSKRGKIEAERRNAVEKLESFVQVMLENSGTRGAPEYLTRNLAEIFGADDVALYDRNTDVILRSGANAGVISDETLRQAATRKNWPKPTGSAVSVVPILHAGEIVGSLGMSGGPWTDELIQAIAGRLGLGLAMLFALEKTTEAEVVQRSEELKSAMLDSVTHDFRNPLNSVKLAATTLLSVSGNNPARLEMLTIINEEADRMDRLIDEAVQMAHVAAGELSPHPAPCNLANLVPDAVAEMGERARRRPIRISFPDTLPPARCDAKMIRSVLKQLLGNAVKYTPDGSPLQVSGELKEDTIVVDVIDHGPGVAEDERERIFEKYSRGRAARPGTRGTGLGLASARSIVRAHGGEMWVTSPPSGGAAFHFSLPAANAAVRQS